MTAFKKRIICSILCLALAAGVFVYPVTVNAETTVEAPSAILIECSTGKILYEKNSTERRSPASITKLMTLLLTFEAVEDGRVSLEDDVITSEYASSMGGSQVFLAQGEVQTLETMIKCIAVASGNDASVAVAEHIAGSEQAFVEKMNEKAAKLGMNDTHFEDCCGLSDSDNHYSCARDIAVLSRELLQKYPQILSYSGIWMEDIVHETAQGFSVFTLTSTNKLLKQYQYATGLKTGSTTKAKYCLSASAEKDGLQLIAVVMGAPTTKARFSDARTLLTGGFAVCRLYVDEGVELPDCVVRKGKADSVGVAYAEVFRYLSVDGMTFDAVEKEIVLPDAVEAPVRKGDILGYIRYSCKGKELGTVALIAADDAESLQYGFCLKRVFSIFLL